MPDWLDFAYNFTSIFDFNIVHVSVCVRVCICVWVCVWKKNNIWPFCVPEFNQQKNSPSFPLDGNFAQ